MSACADSGLVHDTCRCACVPGTISTCHSVPFVGRSARFYSPVSLSPACAAFRTPELLLGGEGAVWSRRYIQAPNEQVRPSGNIVSVVASPQHGLFLLGATAHTALRMCCLPQVCAEVAAVAERLGVQRVVVGHTVQRGGRVSSRQVQGSARGQAQRTIAENDLAQPS